MVIADPQIMYAIGLLIAGFTALFAFILGFQELQESLEEKEEAEELEEFIESHQWYSKRGT